jgi:hypothetical protein
MSESRSQKESQLNTGGYPDGDVENRKARPQWLVGLLLATSLLVIMTVGACFMFGGELFQRPFLVVTVVIAWLGALVGISMGSDHG